jgi:uncharacterized protein (UPF0333 family)
MKMEQMIVQYLYSNKKVTLQDIGTFTISSDIHIPVDNEKDTILPENAIEFKYDPKAGEDAGLIDYIVANSRKIKPLATSDLESFISLNKQFLNIGKPLVMEGLGTLHKTQVGDYAFTQAGTSHVMQQDAPKIVTEKIIEKVSFATPPKEKSSGINKMAIVSILALVVLGAIGLWAYYFINKNKETNTENSAEITTAAKDTSNTNKTTNADTSTLNKPKDTTAPAAVRPINTADSNSFYIVIKEFTDVALAQKRYAVLTGYGNKLVLTTKDSVTYKLRMPFRKPLTDTLRVKDSIGIFFQAKTYVELP